MTNFTKDAQPLTGVKVLDFTTLLPGPLAGLMLAEAGAEVIKVERPQGEDMRHFVPQWGDASVLYHLLNRGKKCVTMDLKDPENRPAIENLIREADVVLEQFRPGVMDRLGIGYERCRDLNPKLIFCSITGYGAAGPKADVAGHDLNYIGDTGLLSLSMGDTASPTLPPALIADIGGGSMPAVINVLLALLQREKTGKGNRIDIAMSDAMFMFGYWALAEGQTTGAWPGSGQGLLTGGSPRYHIYPTSDARHVAAAPLEQRFWMVFCDLIDLAPEMRNDLANPARTIAAVAEIIASKPSGHWRDVFAGQDCCCTIVATMEEAFQDPHFVQRGLFSHQVANDAGETIPAAVVAVAPNFRKPADKPQSAPALGGDNETYLKT